MSAIFFDESLPALASTIANELGVDELTRGVALRDTLGRLAYFTPTKLTKKESEKLAKALKEALGNYGRADRLVASAGDIGVEEVIEDPSAVQVMTNGLTVRLVDRRLVGMDWLRAPTPPVVEPPRFIFASIKGGVGRSTALVVAAFDLAQRGSRVLVIDLDFEAPGLGAMLLDDKTIPRFGSIDALVENGINGIDFAFLNELVAPCPIPSHVGRIDVIPAFGKVSLENPANILAKIARAYAEDVDSTGQAASILDQVRSLVDASARYARYDAILVDTRAGLHETTAAAILGLGGDVFLFGLDEPQTFQGYSALLAHLALFQRRGESSPEWLDRLTVVQGKAPADTDRRAAFAEAVEELFYRSGLIDKPENNSRVNYPAEPFHDVPWDEEASVTLDPPRPRPPLAVLEDSRFKNFDPFTRNDVVSAEVYRSSYDALLDHIRDVIAGTEGSPNAG